jgi:hypothetical protein
MALRPLTEQEKLDIEVGKMIRRVASNPKTRRPLYQSLKAVDPNVRWPDQDIEDFKADWAKKEKDKELREQAKKHQETMESQRAALVQNYDEEHVKKIEKLMQKHGLYDYELGAKLYNAESPMPQQHGQEAARGTRWEMPSDKELINNPAKWANDMAYKTIAEFRANRGIRAGQ